MTRIYFNQHPNKCPAQDFSEVYPVPYTTIEVWPNLCGISFLAQCARCGFTAWADRPFPRLIKEIESLCKNKIAELIASAPWVNEQGAGKILDAKPGNFPLKSRSKLHPEILESY